MKKKLFLIIIILTLSFLTFFILLINGAIWFVYPDKTKYPIRGIDISHHNGIINWDKINSDEIHFVIIKSSEGDDLTDHLFLDNWNKSGKAGFCRGAYHFYSLRIDGKKQAENFIKTVPVTDASLPPFIDLEFGGNSKLRPSKEDFINELKIFINLLESNYKKKPILYSTNEFYKKYLIGELTEYEIWIRNIFFKPEIMGDGRNWKFWQYNSRGHIKGINGFVDKNVFNGDINKFNELLEIKK